MKKSLAFALAILPLSGLAACNEGSSPSEKKVSGDVVADRLNDAATQSGPKAKKVLEQAAIEARASASLAPVDAPGSFGQRAMQKAGNAEASAAPSEPR